MEVATAPRLGVKFPLKLSPRDGRTAKNVPRECVCGFKYGVRVCVCWKEKGKQRWNDDPVISPEATSALVEQASSKKPRPTFLEHSASIHHPLQDPSSKPPRAPPVCTSPPSTPTKDL